ASGQIVGPAICRRLLHPERQTPAVRRETHRAVGTDILPDGASGSRAIDPNEPARGQPRASRRVSERPRRRDVVLRRAAPGFGEHAGRDADRLPGHGKAAEVERRRHDVAAANEEELPARIFWKVPALQDDARLLRAGREDRDRSFVLASASSPDPEQNSSTVGKSRRPVVCALAFRLVRSRETAARSSGFGELEQTTRPGRHEHHAPDAGAVAPAGYGSPPSNCGAPPEGATR